MPRYSWEGRARGGATARGTIDAPSKDAALQKIQGAGVVVTRVEAESGEDEATPAIAVPEPPAPAPPARYRDGESWRDKLFYIGVAAVFTALGIGAAYVAPILTYDCARDANGLVSCTIHRRMYGFIPLGDLRIPHVLAVERKTGAIKPSMSERNRTPTSYDALVLVSPDGSRWQSIDSTWPVGAPNSTIEDGIEGLLSADAPASYRAWTGEGVPLLVAVAFLLPLGLILLALAVKILVPSEVIYAKVAGLEADLARRRGRPRPDL